jgi:hypothetical protein
MTQPTHPFSQPDPFTFGNTGRVLPDAREDGIKNFDFSTQKNFGLTVRLRLQFRGELFNIFNTPSSADRGPRLATRHSE